MRILILGGTGTIGDAVAKLLGNKHEILRATRSDPKHPVDVSQVESIRALFQKVGSVDAVVSAVGSARFAPLDKLSDEDFQFSLGNKLMGQVNAIRTALPQVRDGGSITVTSGVLAWHPMPGSAAISLVNAGVEAFAGAAAAEAPRKVRVNVVSPPWVTETLEKMKWNVPGARTAADVAQLYARSIEGGQSGHVIRFGTSGAVESVPLSQR